MFLNRDDAATRLSSKLKGRPMRDPIVLAIPRGGVVLGAALARRLGADLDVVLAGKLRAPCHPAFTAGAVGEDGSVHIDPEFRGLLHELGDSLDREIASQKAEIARRKELLRGRRVPDLTGRSVIVTD